MFFQEKFNRSFQTLMNGVRESSFLLAVSGGVDSMVLLSQFVYNKPLKMRSEIQVAHINYKLRDKDSDLDQELVENFCRENHIKYHIYEVSEGDNKPDGSIQLWARELRYQFFREIQKKENLKYLVTAHHLNDQLETFFINLSRGSGIIGLGGIPADDNEILRPLLSFSKEEIYTYAKENNIPFREDISNQKNDYLRNKIRNKIVPEIIQIEPNFLENFGKSIGILSQAKDFINSQIDKILEGISLKKGNGFLVLDKENLSKESPFVKFEILRKFGFNSVNEISKIFFADTGKSFYSDKYKLLINRGELVLLENKKKDEKQQIILHKFSKFNTLDEIQYKIMNCELAPKQDFWYLDKDRIKFPLRLRKREEGDFFYPIGMQGKKKVSKFLKDEKISILDKGKIRILCDADNNILGIIPLRQDRRFVGKNTIKILFS